MINRDLMEVYGLLHHSFIGCSGLPTRLVVISRHFPV